MLPTDSSRNAVDINKTVESNTDLIPSLLTALALSGCNASASYYSIAKGIASLNRLKMAYNYCRLGH